MKKILVSIILAVLVSVLATPVVLAWDTPPDSMSVISCRAYQDLADDGDVSILFYWSSIYSGNYTATPASETIMFQLLDTNGTTVLAASMPYVYSVFNTNGYGWGVSGFYFSAADNLTWGQNYYIRIVQSPVYFETPVTTTYTMSSTDWSTASTQEDGRTALKTYVLQLCDLLAGHYSELSMKASLEGGIYFNAYGESYFRAAFTGIQTVCPDLFVTQIYDPIDFDNPNPYDLSLQEDYSIRLQGSEVKRGADRLAEYFGLTGYFILGLLILIACIGLGVFTQRKGWGLEPGLLGASIIAVAGAVLMGNAVFTMVMIAALIAVIAIMFQFFHKRA
jgi:hypothetical protein